MVNNPDEICEYKFKIFFEKTCMRFLISEDIDHRDYGIHENPEFKGLTKNLTVEKIFIKNKKGLKN